MSGVAGEDEDEDLSGREGRQYALDGVGGNRVKNTHLSWKDGCIDRYIA